MIVSSIRDIAAAVRGRRKDLGLNQAELAERAQVSRKWVYEFEGGKGTAEFGLLLRVLEELELVMELAPPATSSRGTKLDLDVVLDEHRRT